MALGSQGGREEEGHLSSMALHTAIMRRGGRERGLLESGRFEGSKWPEWNASKRVDNVTFLRSVPSPFYY